MNFNSCKVQLVKPIGSKIRTGKEEKTCILGHLQIALSIMGRPFLKIHAIDICHAWKTNKQTNKQFGFLF